MGTRYGDRRGAAALASVSQDKQGQGRSTRPATGMDDGLHQLRSQRQQQGLAFCGGAQRTALRCAADGKASAAEAMCRRCKRTSPPPAFPASLLPPRTPYPHYRSPVLISYQLGALGCTRQAIVCDHSSRVAARRWPDMQRSAVQLPFAARSTEYYLHTLSEAAERSPLARSLHGVPSSSKTSIASSLGGDSPKAALAPAPLRNLLLPQRLSRRSGC